jgi:hypothetical protein
VHEHTVLYVQNYVKDGILWHLLSVILESLAGVIFILMECVAMSHKQYVASLKVSSSNCSSWNLLIHISEDMINYSFYTYPPWRVISERRSETTKDELSILSYTDYWGVNKLFLASFNSPKQSSKYWLFVGESQRHRTWMYFDDWVVKRVCISRTNEGSSTISIKWLLAVPLSADSTYSSGCHS